MRRYDNLRLIQQLDPVRDHHRIHRISIGYEFPWDTLRANELALLRVYCIPTISALLDRTGEFRVRTQKRYDDSVLTLYEIAKHGYDSERGRAAIRRMNRIHHYFTISNEDYLYTLSTIVFEPIRWNARFGWRPLCQHEKLAAHYFWREVGRRMNIAGIPETMEEFERFSREYERTRFRYTDESRRVGIATPDLILSWYPRLARPAMTPWLYALIDEDMLDCFGFPHPPRTMRHALELSLRTRGHLVRFLRARRTPRFFVDDPNRTYPNGYDISDFGPPALRDELNRREHARAAGL